MCSSDLEPSQPMGFVLIMIQGLPVFGRDQGVDSQFGLFKYQLSRPYRFAKSFNHGSCLCFVQVRRYPSHLCNATWRAAIGPDYLGNSSPWIF